MNEQEMLNRLDSDRAEHLWVLFHDYGGRPLGKTVPRHRFASTLEHGLAIPIANVAFTFLNDFAIGARYLADCGDVHAVPDPDSYAIVPYRESVARMFAFLRAEDGSAWDGCPRTRLQHMLEVYASEGLSVQVAFESEFTLFEKADDGGGYLTADTYGAYTAHGLERYHGLWDPVHKALHAMDVLVEQHGKEDGPGQYEMTTRHAHPIKAADDYLTLKDVVRTLAREAGWVATFMPKPYEDKPGNGLHLHLSLWDADGTNELSMGETDNEPLSSLGQHFVGGLLKHASALTGLGAPIVNSYKRLLPGSWAPAHICWGIGNRSVLVRVPAMGRRRHIEFRSGDNAANPYMFLAAILAAGMDGIRNQIELPEPIDEDVGLKPEVADALGLALLPRTLPEALDALEASGVIADALGSVLFPEFLKIKRTELAEYNLKVHAWEREIYLETI